MALAESNQGAKTPRTFRFVQGVGVGWGNSEEEGCEGSGVAMMR